MSDTVGLKLIGERLHAIQAEQRTLRGENELIRKELGRMAGAIVTRDTLNEVLTVLVNRIATFETLMEARMDQIIARLPPA
jgi:formylmethanofuran dehydrogenase subunit E